MAKLTTIKLQRKQRNLHLAYDDGTAFDLSCEYCRVHSPSAEVQGHHPSEAKLVTGKQAVNIQAIEPIGNYAVKLIFDDGHDSGIFTFDYLYELGQSHDEKWKTYTDAVAKAATGAA